MKTKINNIIEGTLKYFVIAVFLVATSTVSAQGELINKYLDDYSSNESFVKVSINSKMFSLFTELEGNTEEEKEFLEVVSKIKGLKILASDSLDGGSKTVFDKAVKDVDAAGYEELMTVKDAEEDVKFSIKEKNGVIEELIMVVGGNEDFAFMSLYGEIDLKTVSRLASTMRLDGLKNLKKLDKDN